MVTSPGLLLDAFAVLSASAVLAGIVGGLLTARGSRWTSVLMLAMAAGIVLVIAQQLVPAMPGLSSAAIGVPAGLVVGGLLGGLAVRRRS